MNERQKTKMSQFIGLSMALFGLWILLSGKFEIKFLLCGIISSMVVSYVCVPILNLKKGEEGKKYFFFKGNLLNVTSYVFWLLKEIMKASIDVTKIIFMPKDKIKSKIVYFDMNYENPVATVILANSIIMTPGTITLDVTEEGVFTVHAITEKIGKDLLTGEMAMRVANLYGETCDFIPMGMEDYKYKEGVN